jgi:hypothetical protein
VLSSFVSPDKICCADAVSFGFLSVGKMKEVSFPGLESNAKCIYIYSMPW